MRVLHTADWHLGKTLEGRSRLNEQEQFIDELVTIVKEEKVDVVLMAGDAFDTVNPPARAEQLFYESLSRLADGGKRSVAVIAGNHDNPERLIAASPLIHQQNIHLIGFPCLDVVNIAVPKKNQMMKLAALAYPSEARLQDVLSEDHEEILMRDNYDQKVREIFQMMEQSFSDDTVNFAMSHIYVQGGSSSDSERPIEVGGAYTVAATSLPKTAQYTALGHLHRPQQIKRSHTMSRYSGSPLAYSFSEAGYAKSVSIIDIDPKGTPDLKEVPLSSGKPLVIWKPQNGLKEAFQWIEEGKDQQAWVDLELHLTESLALEDIQRLRKNHPGIIHIRPIFTEEKEIHNQKRVSDLPIDQVFARFYKKQTGGAEPSQELINLFIELIDSDEYEGEKNEAY
ncbi:exonuclease SbcCD subunit D [Bacillus carboniphilus]|uniref:Nuclease SbcCD subunit D n=1 Tax=Bacillus carboniphilus TaxID=86663 RepID=A0ABY9JZ40_9BACI|nr:exonuclease SbcCD subunit D [Bacillus carboniphilus]WLR42901.1 exonuclease SbcCD subunit D [Bacillus carboniphilus]